MWNEKWFWLILIWISNVRKILLGNLQAYRIEWMETSQNDSSIYINKLLICQIKATSFCSSHRLNSIFNIQSEPKITIITIAMALNISLNISLPFGFSGNSQKSFRSESKLLSGSLLFIHSQSMNDAVWMPRIDRKKKKTEWNKHTEMINVRWLDFVERFGSSINATRTTQYIATFPYNIEPA